MELQGVDQRAPDAGQFVIREPGRYTLPRNIDFSQRYGAGHSFPDGGSVVLICSGDVELDLAGHTIAIRHGLSGVTMNAENNRDSVKAYGERFARADSRFVTIRNGTIDQSHDVRSDDAIVLVDAWSQPAQMGLPHGVDTHRVGIVPVDVHYVRNDFLFEKIKVSSNGIGIASEGSHTIIRDCTIESAGGAALFCAGPDVLIENCEIRLTPLTKGVDQAGNPLRAAIVLRDGTNAIIRNNRIRVDTGGLSSDTHCILVRDGATNVLVENNTFINVDGETITMMEGAQVVSRGNTSERRS